MGDVVGSCPTMVSSEPAWLKPAKFAGSVALMSATIGWLGVCLPVRERFRHRVSLIVGGGFMIEIALIGGQAARGDDFDERNEDQPTERCRCRRRERRLSRDWNF